MIKVSKKDIWWSYFAQFFNISSGIIILPLILSMLSAEEIGMNYLMLTIATLVALFDFGFAPQFGRNITYVLSGAQKLTKKGIDYSNKGKEINYRLLATMIHTARYVYQRMSLIVLVVMLTFGSAYIYRATNGFTNVEHSLFIWILFSISTFFNIYFTYYKSLLTGKGLIMESNKAKVYSRIVYIFLAASLLFLGIGLMSVVIANLVAPFVDRYISYNFFFTKELKSRINPFDITTKEKLDLFKIVWYNTKKLGLVFIGSYVVTKFGMFIAGLYLSLPEIASYGLMMQFIRIILTVSGTMFTVYHPRFSSLRVAGDTNSLIRDFAFSMNIRYVIYIIGAGLLIFAGPWALDVIGSNAELPSFTILIVYSLIMLLESNHASFASIIVTNNDVPFVKPALITGGFIILGSFIVLQFTDLGILGLILVQGVAQLAYSNWKWPDVVCKEFKISFISFLEIGLNESFNKIKTHFLKLNQLKNSTSEN